MSTLITLNGQRILSKYTTYRNDWHPLTIKEAKHAVEDMLRWLDDKPLNAATLQTYVTNLSKVKKGGTPDKICKHVVLFCKWLHQEKWLKDDPTLFLDKPKKILPKVAKGYDEKEYMTLRDNADPMMRSFYIVGYYTGMAMVDICKLLWSDVDLDKMMITRMRQKMFKRSQSTQYVPIIPHSELHNELLQLRDKYYKGNPVSPVNPDLHYYYVSDPSTTALIQRMKRMCKRIGVAWRGTHGFRRAFCSAVANDENMNKFHALNATGHRSLEGLQRYVTPDPEKITKSLTPVLQERINKIT